MKNTQLFLTLTLCLLLSNCSNSENSSTPSPLIQPANTTSIGGVDGGGGKGILCGNELFTLDLFEARKNGLMPLSSFGSLSENLKKFGVELAKHFSESNDIFYDPQIETMILKEMNDSVVSRFQDIPTGTRLSLTNDATLPILPSHCQVVQIAVYAKDGTIHRDSEYWSKLNVVEQAALIVHEWIYHRARQYGALDSDESRKVLGHIFSGHNPEPLLAPLWSTKKKFWCGAGIQDTEQEIYEIFGKEEFRNGVTGTALYFRAFKSKYVTSRTVAFLPGITPEDFMEGRFQQVRITASNELMKHRWNLEITPEVKHSGYSLSAFDLGGTQPPQSHGFCKWE